jgi:hypothetical protein
MGRFGLNEIGTDRDLIVTMCRAWTAKLGTILAALESGEELSEACGEAEKTIKKLIAALRERARRVAYWNSEAQDECCRYSMSIR